MEYSLYWWLVARTNKEIARGDYFELGKVCILWDKFHRNCLFFDDMRKSEPSLTD